MNKYTPAPWHIKETLFKTSGMTLLQLYNDTLPKEKIVDIESPNDTDYANAKLISQAPAMLNIIKHLLIQPDLLKDQMYVDQIRKVIDDARGFDELTRFTTDTMEGK